MKCENCGHNKFTAIQTVIGKVIIDGKQDFLGLLDTVIAEDIEGPYECENCGTEYEELY